MIQGALSLTDYFARCPGFPSPMEQCESHESGLDLNGGQFIYGFVKMPSGKQIFYEVQPSLCLMGQTFCFLCSVVQMPHMGSREG